MPNSVLTKDFGSAGNRKTMTFSFWVKRNKISAEGDQFIGDIQTSYPSHFIKFDGSDQLDIRSQSGVSGETFRFTTTRKFKDLSSWYHIVVAIDTTQASAGDRCKVYVNGGSAETSFGTSDQTNGFGQNSDTHFNQGAKTEYIGRYDSSYANFNLAHYHFVDGTALTPTTFGETDSTTGEWKAKLNPSVTYGTHGFFLKFENSGALGTDSSGNSKTFTVVGNLKQSNSSPSNTFPTLDDLQIKNANKIFNAGTTQLSYANQTDNVNCTQMIKTGKWYWEVKSETDATNESYCIQMYLNGSVSAYAFTYQSNNSQVGRYTDGSGWTYFPNNTTTNSAPKFIFENSATNYGVAATADDIVMCAVDLSNATTGKVWFGKNGTWHNAPGTSNVGNPATGANPGISFAKKDDFWGIAISSGDNAANNSTKNTHINFGTGFFGTTAVSSAQADDNNVGIFEYDVPAGFYAICSKNIKDYG